MMERETLPDGSHLWRRVDTGETSDYPHIAPGAMWFAPWYSERHPERRGADEKCLVVHTPGGNWIIDSRANNCTRPDDDTHKCWVRHGTAPEISVDKNGDTCAAGAGSIQCGSYHGFLRNGILQEC
jgi:hypothetical protein